MIGTNLPSDTIIMRNAYYYIDIIFRPLQDSDARGKQAWNRT